jgi:release factor glutamine methyltransferase
LFAKMLPRRFFRWFWLPFYRRWALRKITQTQVVHLAGLRLNVPSGVFHPTLFFSTPIFISFLQDIDFQGKKVLDVGTGTGALALFAAQKGASTTALDIAPLAVKTTRDNAHMNQLEVAVHQSDLFGQLAATEWFDYILVNPPYYPKAAHSDAEKAFFAGEGLTYFDRFFEQVGMYCRLNTRIWMILSEDCDLSDITATAVEWRFSAQIVFERRHWGERFWVLELLPLPPNQS